jgi:hypothetical protein
VNNKTWIPIGNWIYSVHFKPQQITVTWISFSDLLLHLTSSETNSVTVTRCDSKYRFNSHCGSPQVRSLLSHRRTAKGRTNFHKLFLLTGVLPWICALTNPLPSKLHTSCPGNATFRNVSEHGRFEAFTAMTTNNVVFWDIGTQFIPHRRYITSPLQSPAG